MIADSSRWHDFAFRDDDVVITTPSKCGTTWMQTLVGSLIFGKSDFGSVSEISLWYDALLRSKDDAAAIVEAQTHRRFLKTHAPLDGIPVVDGVTYIAVTRHPLDVALSRFDHRGNQDHELTERIRRDAVDAPMPPPPNRELQPQEPDQFVRWWIDNDRDHLGVGALGLADLSAQAKTYWGQRDHPGVHLFHYSDLWNDLESQLGRLASILGLDVDDEQLNGLAKDASLDSMRDRAELTAPEAHLGIWKAADTFFSQGGTRNWAELLTQQDLDHFADRLASLAGDAAPWMLGRFKPERR